MQEEFTEYGVPVHEVAPDAAAFFGKMYEAVRLILHKAEGFQRLERTGHSTAAHACGFGYGFGPGRAFPRFFVEDDFDVIFQNRGKFLLLLVTFLGKMGFGHAVSVISCSLTFYEAVFKPFFAFEKGGGPEECRNL